MLREANPPNLFEFNFIPSLSVVVALSRSLCFRHTFLAAREANPKGKIYVQDPLGHLKWINNLNRESCKDELCEQTQLDHYSSGTTVLARRNLLIFISRKEGCCKAFEYGVQKRT